VCFVHDVPEAAIAYDRHGAVPAQQMARIRMFCDHKGATRSQNQVNREIVPSQLVPICRGGPRRRESHLLDRHDLGEVGYTHQIDTIGYAEIIKRELGRQH
jgi:hypothetical protein